MSHSLSVVSLYVHLGGGPSKAVDYTAIEEEMLQLIDRTTIHGLMGIEESEEASSQS